MKRGRGGWTGRDEPDGGWEVSRVGAVAVCVVVNEGIGVVVEDVVVNDKGLVVEAP